MGFSATEVARARSQRLLSTERTRLRLRLGESEAEVEAVGLVIDEVSSMAVEEIGREIVLQTYSHRRVGEVPDYWLTTENWPVDVSSTRWDDGGVAEAWGRPDAGRLCRRNGQAWPASGVLTYDAGWVPNHLIFDWKANTARSAGEWIRPSFSPGLVEVTADYAGAAEEPTWTALGADADMKYRSQVKSVPHAIDLACYEAALLVWRRRQWPRDLVEMSVEGVRWRFEEQRAQAGDLPPRIRKAWSRYRAVVF